MLLLKYLWKDYGSRNKMLLQIYTQEIEFKKELIFLAF
jgi:hypothetical protein